jgi:hypothetical protein
VPQHNVVELVPAGQLTCEIDLGGDHLTRNAGAHGLNATDPLSAVHRLDSHRTSFLFLSADFLRVCGMSALQENEDNLHRATHEPWDHVA